MGGGWSHAAKSRRAAELRRAELWLDQNADRLPHPLTPHLIEHFGLRRRDAYMLAQRWNERRNGTGVLHWPPRKIT